MFVRPWPANLVRGLEDAVDLVFGKGERLEQVLKQVFQSHPKWGKRDRHSVAQALVSISKYFLWLCSKNTLDPRYQLERAQTAQITQSWLECQQVGLPELSPAEFFEPWIYAELTRTHSQEVLADWVRAFLKPARIFLRVNSLRAKVQDVELEMSNNGWPYRLHSDWTLELLEHAPVIQSKAFRDGWIEIQDLNSQATVNWMNLAGARLVVDACAGHGGKTLQMADRMQGRGRIIASDISESRLEKLRVRRKRAQAQNVEIRLLKSQNIKRLKHSVDVLVLDVPCSGTGVLRRKPDTQWKLTQSLLAEYHERQLEILSQYSSVTKVGGLIYYITCSIFAYENEQVVAQFLVDHPEFILLRQHSFRPSIDGGDGFFIAEIQRQ